VLREPFTLHHAEIKITFAVRTLRGEVGHPRSWLLRRRWDPQAEQPDVNP